MWTAEFARMKCRIHPRSRILDFDLCRQVGRHAGGKIVVGGKNKEHDCCYQIIEKIATNISALDIRNTCFMRSPYISHKLCVLPAFFLARSLRTDLSNLSFRVSSSKNASQAASLAKLSSDPSSACSVSVFPTSACRTVFLPNLRNWKPWTAGFANTPALIVGTTTNLNLRSWYLPTELKWPENGKAH